MRIRIRNTGTVLVQCLLFEKSNLDASVGSEILGRKVISLTMSASYSAEANLVFSLL
jgi:hypothetical protein